jgi:hypothetical protein
MVVFFWHDTKRPAGSTGGRYVYEGSAKIMRGLLAPSHRGDRRLRRRCHRMSEAATQAIALAMR